MEKEKILIVDDDARNIEFIRDSLLVPSGYTALSATDGEEALHLALTEEPDLVLLDLQMPKLDGFDVLEALRQAGRDIPVILITAYGSENVAAQAFRLGVRDYFPKPFKVTEMMEAVQRSLAEAHLTREKEELAARIELANRELEQRLRQLTILYGISKSVTSLLDLDKLLIRIVEATMYVTGAEEISLFLLDEETQELQLRAVQRAGDREARGVKESGDDAVVRQVMTTGQVAMIQSRRSRKTDPLQVALAVPLKSRDTTIGVLHATTDNAMEPLSDNDRYVLSVLADFAAIAIENARLFQEVEEQRGKLETILTGTEDVIVVTDENGRVLLMNPAAAEAFDADATQSVGKPILEVTGYQMLKELLSRKMGRQIAANLEVSLPDGRTSYASLSPIPDVGWALIMRDITHIKELDKMKSDFVSTITHDLRSPLTSIQSLIEMLHEVGELNEEQEEFTGRAMRIVEHMQDLTSSLLDIARIEAGIDMQTGAMRLDVVVEAAIQNLETAAQAKELSLEVILPDDLSAVDGNHARLVQVMTNLLDNAIKYTASSGSIEVRAEEDEDQVTVYVTDTGVGIPASARPHIFDKFYRVQSPTTHEAEGVGLGLATVKSIVEKHGGQVFVESRVGHGSTFYFTLPKARMTASVS